jgi:hypothetical protein
MRARFLISLGTAFRFAASGSRGVDGSWRSSEQWCRVRRVSLARRRRLPRPTPIRLRVAPGWPAGGDGHDDRDDRERLWRSCRPSGTSARTRVSASSAGVVGRLHGRRSSNSVRTPSSPRKSPEGCSGSTSRSFARTAGRSHCAFESTRVRGLNRACVESGVVDFWGGRSRTSGYVAIVRVPWANLQGAAGSGR